MGNLELERTSYIGFVSGKILSKTFLRFFYKIFCGGKKIKKKANLVRKKHFFKVLMKNFFIFLMKMFFFKTSKY
jgi:hypothetical protein